MAAMEAGMGVDCKAAAEAALALAVVAWGGGTGTPRAPLRRSERRSFATLGAAAMPEVFFVVRCNPQRERIAAEGLAELDFSVFLPTVLARWRTPHGRPAQVERALFPGYLFAGWCGAGDFPSWLLEGVSGVNSVIRIDGVRMPVPAAVVAELMRRQAEGEFATDRGAPVLPPLVAGQSVAVLDGPFAACAGLVHALMPCGHALVMVQMFGRANAIKFHRASLRG